jgi:hypothetical protein
MQLLFDLQGTQAVGRLLVEIAMQLLFDLQGTQAVGRLLVETRCHDRDKEMPK